MLSIVTINLNNREGLIKTINSVVSQTYTDIQYIIIDGESSDGSVEVIKRYKDKIAFWVSEKDNGLYNAMNKGIKVAIGDYILFLNSGDWLFDQNGIAKVLDFIKEDSDICSADIYHDDGHALSLHPSPQQADFHYLFNYSLPHPSTFIRRSLFNEFGLYNETNKIASDWEFFFYVLIMKGRRYQKINYPLSVFDLGGISNKPSMQSLIRGERQKVLNSFIPQAVQEESVSLRKELAEYQALQRRVNNRRYHLLEEIEKNGLLARLLTLIMIPMSKLSLLIKKVSK